MLGDLALVEDDLPPGIDAASDEGRGDPSRMLRELDQIRHAVIAYGSTTQ